MTNSPMAKVVSDEILEKVRILEAQLLCAGIARPLFNVAEALLDGDPPSHLMSGMLRHVADLIDLLVIEGDDHE